MGVVQSRPLNRSFHSMDAAERLIGAVRPRSDLAYYFCYDHGSICYQRMVQKQDSEVPVKWENPVKLHQIPRTSINVTVRITATRTLASYWDQNQIFVYWVQSDGSVCSLTVKIEADLSLSIVSDLAETLVTPKCADSHVIPCFHNRRRYLFFKGTDGTIQFTTSSVRDNKRWFSNRRIPIEMCDGLDRDSRVTVRAAHSHDNQLVLFLTSDDDDDDNVYAIRASTFGKWNEVKTWVDHTDFIDNATFLLDMKVMASIILSDEEVFERLYNFSSLASAVNDESIRKAKNAIAKDIKKVEAVEAKMNTLGDSADDTAIAASSAQIAAAGFQLGAIAAAATVVGAGIAAGLEDAALASEALSLLLDAKAVALEADERAQRLKLDKQLKKLEKYDDPELMHSKAFAAHHSMIVLHDLTVDYKAYSTVFPAENFFPLIFGAFNHAVENSAANVQAQKHEFKNLLSLYASVIDDKSLLNQLSGLDITYEEMKGLLDYDGSSSRDRIEDQLWVKASMFGSKVGKFGVKFDLKHTQFLKKAALKSWSAITHAGNSIAKGYAATKGYFFPRRAHVHPEAPNPPPAMVNRMLPGAVRFPRAARLVRGLTPPAAVTRGLKSFGKRALPILSIGLSIYGIVNASEDKIERHKEHADFVVAMRHFREGFVDAMLHVQHFQRVYFPRPGDYLKSELDSLYDEQMKEMRTYMDEWVGGGMQMGLYVVNRSKFSFKMKLFDTWHGDWWALTSKIHGTAEIQKYVDANRNSTTSIGDVLNTLNPQLTTRAGGSSRGAGFEAMFLLYEEDAVFASQPIQIPIFMSGAYSYWWLMGAYANIRGFYTGKSRDDAYNHIYKTANDKNKFYSYGGDGGTIRKDTVVIEFSKPGAVNTVTIYDA